MKKFSKLTFIFSLILLTFLQISCADSELNKKYADDACYYMALTSLKNGNSTEAERFFRTAIKKASPVIKRRAMEEYAKLGSVQDRIERHLELYKAFPCEETLHLLCKELYEQKEYARIINLTKNIDLSSANNETVFFRIDSLYKKSDSRFKSEFFSWCTQRAFSDEHYKMYCILPESDEIIEFRTLVYNRRYTQACEKAKILLKNPQNFISQILSDAGKSFLYGSNDFLSSAYYWDSLTEKLDGNLKFYSYFYAGRCYDKTSSYKIRALNRFKSAMESAKSDSNYDNALWYYFNASLKNSISEAISAVKNYAVLWHNPYYFDDFFETLSVRLLSQHKYEQFYDVYKIIDSYASNEITAKYAYISARLIQENFIHLEKSEADEKTKSLFTRALSGDTDLYYRLLAAQRLSLEENEIKKIIQSFGKRVSIKINPDAEKLLLGYADFGLAEFIYADWQRFCDEIGIDCAQKISFYLQKCGNENNSYFTQSLRIASKKANYPETNLYPQFLTLVFPQNFKTYVEESCADFGQKEYILYALIRSESFFNPIVVSHAGAVGLTQLMKSTAGDVARKLKVADYNLEDCRTNIRFGSYYFEEMKRRLGGSEILAIFAYNGGITRVRQWIKSAELEFGTKNLSKDLFLESIPFEETREYGRKLVSASAMYAFLYQDISIHQVIEEIMQ